MDNILPKQITVDSNGQIAHFSYYDGIAYAEKNNLKFSSSLSEVRKGTHYVVSCGDVMISVNPEDFPEINRRRL